MTDQEAADAVRRCVRDLNGAIRAAYGCGILVTISTDHTITQLPPNAPYVTATLHKTL